jgi:hypothetical protein
MHVYHSQGCCGGVAFAVVADHEESARGRTFRYAEHHALPTGARVHYAEAETLYERMLAANEKMLGMERPETLVTLRNLASVCWSQGIIITRLRHCSDGNFAI